jgi:phytoene dehydrogenase-like protein
MRYDVIVIGAGHNGLTAGTALAQSGRKVLILERRDLAGGLAASEEFHPSFRTQGLLQETTGVRPEVAIALGLSKRGLKFRDEEPGQFVPESNGPGVLIHRNPDRFEQDNPKLSDEDRAAYRGFRSFLDRVRPFIRGVLEQTPPPITDKGTEGLWTLLKTGIALRRLGRDDLHELLRIGPMCAADWLNERFQSDALKVGLAAPALHGSMYGPWSAGSTASFLLREAAANKSVVGGPAGLTRALLAAASEAGAEIRTGAEVRSLRVSGGTVHGVSLANGENIDAPVVAASCDPKRTFFGLLDPADVPDAIAEQIRVVKMRGTTAAVRLALEKPLAFPGRPDFHPEEVLTGNDIDSLERAYDAAKYGEMSETPHLAIKVPTLAERDIAPEGNHVAEILVHFAPYKLKGGWNEASREELGKRTLKVLETYSPGAEASIAAKEILTPADFEDRYGLTEGHIFHGEHSLDQLHTMRPSADTSGYTTPIEGLFLCGSGSHPGGGITCAPGALAADVIKSAS